LTESVKSNTSNRHASTVTSCWTTHSTTSCWSCHISLVSWLWPTLLQCQTGLFVQSFLMIVLPSSISVLFRLYVCLCRHWKLAIRHCC